MKIWNYFTLVLLLSLTASAFPVEKKSTDLSRYFGDFDGAFVLYDMKADTLLVHNPKQSEKRFSPWATYDIVCALIALETRNARDETFVLPWDGTQNPNETWNRNHTLESAMRNSVDWYFKDMIRKMGAMRVESFMNRVDYGNRNIIGGLDRFWLGSTLKLSAFEQVEFLHALCAGGLPFSRRSLDIVKSIITLEKTDSYVLKGKDGSDDTGGFAWFVGWVERGGNVYIFATNIKGKNNATGVAAKEITVRILKDSRIL